MDDTFLDTVSPLHHHPRAQDTGRGIVSPIFSDKSPDVQENFQSMLCILLDVLNVNYTHGVRGSNILENYEKVFLNSCSFSSSGDSACSSKLLTLSTKPLTKTFLELSAMSTL